MLLYIMLYIVLAYLMLYIVLAYLMLFAALSNAVCLYNASFFANDFSNCFLFSCFLILCSHRCCFFLLKGLCALRRNST